METVAYSLWCLRQAAPSDGTAPTLYDELGALFAHPDNYISDSGVVLNWMIDTLLKSVESPLGAVRAASWPGHYDPAKILRSMVDARSQVHCLMAVTILLRSTDILFHRRDLTSRFQHTVWRMMFGQLYFSCTTSVTRRGRDLLC